MTMGLTPKNKLQNRDLNWNNLNDTLHSTINFVGDTATIKLSDYPSLTEAEIKAEAKKNGYTVTNKSEGYLEFS